MFDYSYKNNPARYGGRLVADLAQRRAARADVERVADAYAPTATFRWAKSSPSAPAVLQQKWIIPGSGFEEWRELETVVHDEMTVSVPAGEADKAKAALLDMAEIAFGATPAPRPVEVFPLPKRVPREPLTEAQKDALFHTGSTRDGAA